ncbi:MAG: amidohydrolase [Candidatus Bathyarchaeia archaeon]
MSETLLIKNGIVVTVDDSERVIERGAILVEGNKIAAVGREDQVISEMKQTPDYLIDATGMAVLPGLVDLHFHTAIAKGVNDGMPLDKFLDNFWYPKLRLIRPEEVFWAAMNSYAEAIKSGTTCVNDMYRHMGSAGNAAEKIGIRAVLSSDAADKSEGLDTLEDNEKVIKEKNGAANGKITARVGVEWVPIASIEFLSKVRKLADKYHVGIHIHLNESLAELEMSKKRHGKRPVELAYDLGILGPDCVAAHCVWLTGREIALLKSSGANVSYDPGSNAKLGNGICPAPDLISAGVNVGLGHDDNECNNTSDLFETMKFGAVIQRASRVDASLMPASQMIEMATRNGSRALGIPAGSLAPGRLADIILINLKTPRLTPVVMGKNSNILSHLVFAAHGEDVHTSIIDGNIVMEDRKLMMVDEDEIILKATESCNSLLERIPNS